MTKNFINFVPEEIMFNILTRLTTESVLECKLVWKSWKRLIHHPSFAQLHLTHLNLPPNSSKLSYIYFNLRNHENNQLYYFDYSEDWIQKPSDSMTMFSLTPTFDSYVVLGSFNGLICIFGRENDDLYGPACICNPITQEYVILPEYPGSGCVEAWGFGYLPSTSEYKVVQIYGFNSLEVEVYTVGSGNGWRNVGKFDFTFHPYYDNVGVFANGALHWSGQLSFGWSKEFSLSHREPFTFTNRGHSLFYDQGRLKYYRSDLTSHIFMSFSDICRQVFPHKHTLISLKQLGEEDTENMKAREVEESGVRQQ